MISLLQTIVDQFVCWIMTGVIAVIDLFFVAVGAALAAAVAIAPGMPTMPTLPTWINDGYVFTQYFFPVSYFFTLAISLGVLWLAWLLIAIPLRWGKALPGAE